MYSLSINQNGKKLFSVNAETDQDAIKMYRDLSKKFPKLTPKVGAMVPVNFDFEALEELKMVAKAALKNDDLTNNILEVRKVVKVYDIACQGQEMIKAEQERIALEAEKPEPPKKEVVAAQQVPADKPPAE